MTGDDRFDYNLRAIRDLILAAYSADELRALVSWDKELGQLHYEFADSDSILDLADKTIEYCLRYLLMDYFLSMVERERPVPYTQFKERLRSTPDRSRRSVG